MPCYHTLLLKVLFFISYSFLRPLAGDNLTFKLFLVYSLGTVPLIILTSAHNMSGRLLARFTSFCWSLSFGFCLKFRWKISVVQYYSSMEIILKLKIPSKQANLLFAVLKVFLYFSLLLTLSLKSHFSVVYFLVCIAGKAYWRTWGRQWAAVYTNTPEWEGL